MLTFSILINNTHAGYVSAVSHRQAKQRAKRLHPRSPVDVIGFVSSKAKV